MPLAVVMGASLQCSCGSAPAKLVVTSQHQAKIDNQLAATVLDHAPATNVPPFGICSVLTAAASGVPTPCVPALPAPWTPGSASEVKIGNHLALLATATLKCSVPGVITVLDAGQKTTQDR
jgi:Domain of unknown function (DUF4280)